MNEKNKNIVIGILTIIVLCLVGLIIFILVKPNNEKVKENKNENQQQETKKYNNYTSAEYIQYEEDGEEIKVTLKIEDGKLVVKEQSNEIKVTGINGKVKSLTYIESGIAWYDILVITTDNKIYMGSCLSDECEFEQIQTTEKVVDITTVPYIIDIFSGMGGFVQKNSLAIVLENGETRIIKEEYVDDNTTSITISDGSYNNLLNQIGDIVLYNDRTIRTSRQVVNETNELIKYNNKNLIVSKVYSKINDGSSDCNYTSDSDICNYISYVVSDDNKLYKIETSKKDDNVSETTKVTLMSDKKVSTTSTKKIGLQQIATYDDETMEVLNATETITFEDGTTIDLQEIDSAYIFK